MFLPFTLRSLDLQFPLLHLSLLLQKFEFATIWSFRSKLIKCAPFTSVLQLFISRLGPISSFNSVHRFEFLQSYPWIEIKNKCDFHFSPSTFDL